MSGIAGNEYQRMAQRTMRSPLVSHDNERHALYGMAAEVGEILSVYQKAYQGHKIDGKNLKEEVGDLLWFIAEYCTVMGWNLEDIMERNIDKLYERCPNGFEEERSRNRRDL